MGVTLWKAKSPIAVTAMLLDEIKQFGVTINHLNYFYNSNSKTALYF